jgi:hypothetical protein
MPPQPPARPPRQSGPGHCDQPVPAAPCSSPVPTFTSKIKSMTPYRSRSLRTACHMLSGRGSFLPPPSSSTSPVHDRLETSRISTATSIPDPMRLSVRPLTEIYVRYRPPLTLNHLGDRYCTSLDTFLPLSSRNRSHRSTSPSAV